MKIEIRSSSETKFCPECGATELIWTGNRPLSTDLTAVFEREMIRRELTLAKVVKEHLETVASEYADREQFMAAELNRQVWELETRYEDLIAEIEQMVLASELTVARWRLLRRRRTRIFSERIAAAINDLVAQTVLEGSGPVELREEVGA